MASKKGIALTAGIAAAIVGSSFLIWYVPQGSFLAPPRADNEVISDVYARHFDLAASIEIKFDQWKNNDLGTDNMTALLDNAKSQLGGMRQELASRHPSQVWQQSYDIYVQALDSFSKYLEALKTKVQDGDRTDPDPSLDQNWRALVDRSVKAMPV